MAFSFFPTQIMVAFVVLAMVLDSSASIQDPLKEWLAAVRIPLGNLTVPFDIPLLGPTALTISNLSCGNISLDTVSSELDRPGLKVSLDSGLSLACDGSFLIGADGIEGIVTLRLAGSELGLNVEVGLGGTGLVRTWTFPVTGPAPLKLICRVSGMRHNVFNFIVGPSSVDHLPH